MIFDPYLVLYRKFKVGNSALGDQNSILKKVVDAVFFYCHFFFYSHFEILLPFLLPLLLPLFSGSRTKKPFYCQWQQNRKKVLQPVAVELKNSSTATGSRIQKSFYCHFFCHIYSHYDVVVGIFLNARKEMTKLKIDPVLTDWDGNSTSAPVFQ